MCIRDIGTGVHRYNPPVGLLLALLMVASAGVLVRAWAGPWGVVVLGAVMLAVIIVLARPRPRHARTVESRAAGAAAATSGTPAGTAREGHDGTSGGRHT